MHLGKKILPPVYFFITLMLMIILHYFIPVLIFIMPPMNYAGAFLILFGVVFVIWSATLFGKVGTPIKPFQESTQLVRGGMYRVTRNPMYLGLSIILVGVAILLGSVTPFIPVPVFVWLIHNLFIVQEELMLEERFGDEYVQYKLSVRRWFCAKCC